VQARIIAAGLANMQDFVYKGGVESTQPTAVRGIANAKHFRCELEDKYKI
jgi:hypothetical protein